MSARTFVSRTAAFIALVALGAACETKTVVTPPPPNPIGVTVSPQSATLTTANQTVQFVALVTGGDNTTARTVTWSSSNTAVATVDANGVAKAVANGTASIIATSTADATAKGAGLVTVNIQGTPPPPVQTPPTVSIAGIFAGNLFTPANLAGVFGTIFVQASADVPAGTTNVAAINFQFDSKTVCSQSMTQGKSTTGDVTAQAANAVTFVCQIKTDSIANGVPVYANGTHTVTVSLVDATGKQLASASQALTLANTSSLALTVTSAKQANDAAGLQWNGGNLTVVVTPQIFNTQTLQTATVTVNDPTNALTATKTVTFTGNTPVTVTFRADSTPANNGLKGFESAGTTVQVNNGVTTAGQNFVGNSGTLTQVTLRYDDKAPVIGTQPTFLINTVGTTSWLSLANTFKTACTGTLPNFTCNLGTAVTDGGVDVVTATFQTAPAPGTQSGVTFTNVGAFSALSNTAANALVARQSICDNLGNCVNSSLSGVFGVDLTAPIVQAVTSVSGVQTAPVTINTAAVDSLSGFDLTNGFIQVQITKDSAKSDGSDVKTCVNASTGATTALPSSGTCAFVTVPGATGSFSIPAGTNGYFTVVIQATDIAGNTSTTTNRFFLIDNVVPTVSGVGVTYTTGTFTAAVNGTIQDNVDLKQYAAYETFAGPIAGVTAIPFAAPTVVKPYGIPVNGKVTASATTPVILGISNAFGTVGTGSTGFGFGGLDQAGNFAIGTVGLVPGAPAAVSGTDVNTWLTGGTHAGVCNASDVTTCAAANAFASVQDSVIIVMANTTTANPIVTMYFYRVVNYGGTDVAQFISSMPTPLPGIPATGTYANLRVYTYKSAALTAADLTAGGSPSVVANSLFAVGVDKNGNGVLFFPVTVNVETP